MKKGVISFIALYFIVISPGFSQEKSRKELKEEKKIEKQKEVEALISSKVFTFVATNAYPQGARSVNLSTNPNFVNFSPDLMKGSMPFFGRAYSGGAYGGDGGIEFDASPEEFSIESKKDNYIVSVVVKGKNDTYRLNMTVTSSGSASLSVNSNNRSTISYQGSVGETNKKE